MNRKLQKSWVLSSMLLLGMNATLPVVHTVFAETTPETQQVEAEELTSPYDNLLEAPADSAEENPQPMEEAPTFSFEHKEMRGTVGKTTEVVIQVDRGIEQVQVTIPEAVIVQLEEFPDGMEASQITETQWWLSAKEQTTFILPLTSETAGSYTIVVEDEVEGSVVFEEPLVEPETEEPTIDSGTSEEEDFVEDTATPEVQEDEESNEQEAEEITPATTSNVSTWAQFRTAINTSSVTVINVLADISGNTSLNGITRNLTINGNGNTINSQNQGYRIANNRQIIVRDAILISSIASGNNLFSPNSTGSSSTGSSSYVFSDVTYSGVAFFVGGREGAIQTVVFDGGTNSFSSTGNATTLLANCSVRITNNSTVTIENRWLMGTYTISTASIGARTSLTVDQGSSLIAKNMVRPIEVNTINILGTLDISNPVSSFSQFTRVTSVPMRISFGKNSQVLMRQSNSNQNTPIVTTTAGTVISIEKGAQFDLINDSSGGIISDNKNSNTSIQAENLAVWRRGAQDRTTPSQNFENLEAQLTGANASTITETNHNVFRSTYSKQGLAGYSRISSSGIAGEGPVDPLTPDTEIDPDNPPVIPENQGEFRIDFASQFVFGEQERKVFEEAVYYAAPQLGLDENGAPIESEPKPNYIQITDNRAEADSWELSVRQSEQFKTGQGRELAGARLQLKNRQIVADHDGAQPRENSSDEIITLEPGEKQPLLTSANGEGKGTWIYRFGDGTSSDQSVVLVVPKETIPEIATYRTQLIWELSAVPINE